MINMLRVKSMQIHVERREHLMLRNVKDAIYTQRMFSYEVMDGCPAPDVVIPLRVPLKMGTNMSPSMDSQYFSVKYFINVTVVDVEDRRYFKQSEINLHREFLGLE